ncbi:iron-containing redox enzyme family protein [Nocardioides aquiterrae]|uniref:Iron-containing redox enzyme family protein n=1 Tax=Nocardioides aquiterrae TaxID=203799 RepID=A0ABN1USH6_9ACTN
MHVPDPRGPLTEELFRALRSGTDDFYTVLAATPAAEGEDAALALWALHELHYRGFDDVDDALEWDPQLVRVRVVLERDLESRLRARFARPEGLSFVEDFFGWLDQQEGASLARHVHRDATYDQAVELLRVKSLYHLKESDPVAWLVPRLGVRAKAALMELQFDEYGDGDPNRLHHHLFAEGLRATGLEASYDAHLEVMPQEAFDQHNTVSMFGLQRRLRGAALGHLAAFEATSSLPSRRMAQGLERLGFPAEMVAYYAEHVEADAVHEQLAVRTIIGALLEEEPELEEDVWFGAFTCLDLDDRFARTMLSRWGADEEQVA